MKYFILFNGMNCLDLNLKVIKRPNVPLPSRNFNELTIQGRNGKLVEDLGTYEDIKIDVEFNFIEKPNLFYEEVRKNVLVECKK
jgi:phage-related protein